MLLRRVWLVEQLMPDLPVKADATSLRACLVLNKINAQLKPPATRRRENCCEDIGSQQPWLMSWLEADRLFPLSCLVSNWSCFGMNRVLTVWWDAIAPIAVLI